MMMMMMMMMMIMMMMKSAHSPAGPAENYKQSSVSQLGCQASQPLWLASHARPDFRGKSQAAATPPQS
jgi:hypothetical protein